MSKSFKQSEVAEHKKPDDLWIIVEGDVYDVTKVRWSTGCVCAIADNACSLPTSTRAERRVRYLALGGACVHAD